MTEVKKLIITLVGSSQAKRGFSFSYEGPLEECVKCALLKVCGEKLEAGRVYAVTKVRNNVFPCEVHEKGVRVVEVVEPDIETNIGRRFAFPRSIITFQPQECTGTSCLNYEKCVPQGLRAGDKCKILEIMDQTAVLCPLNRPLVSATLQRILDEV